MKGLCSFILNSIRKALEYFDLKGYQIDLDSNCNFRVCIFHH